MKSRFMRAMKSTEMPFEQTAWHFWKFVQLPKYYPSNPRALVAPRHYHFLGNTSAADLLPSGAVRG